MATGSPPVQGGPRLAPPAAERSDLRRGRVQVLDDEVEVEPVLSRLRLGDALEPDGQAILRRGEHHALAVAPTDAGIAIPRHSDHLHAEAEHRLSAR